MMCVMSFITLVLFKTRNREICCPYEVLNERREERKKGREEDKNREEISRRERIAHTQRWITGKRGRERKWKMTRQDKTREEIK